MNIKVYIAVKFMDYNPTTILGVFTSKELAQDAIDNDKFPCDGYDIEEHELDIATCNKLKRELYK